MKSAYEVLCFVRDLWNDLWLWEKGVGSEFPGFATRSILSKMQVLGKLVHYTYTYILCIQTVACRTKLKCVGIFLMAGLSW